MDFSKSNLLNEEMRKKSLGSSSSDVLVTSPSGRNKTCDYHNRKQNRRKSKGILMYIESYHCGMKGQTKKLFQKLKRENKDKEETKEDGDENCIATFTTEDLVIVLDADLISISCDESSWVVDTGATSLVTSREKLIKGSYIVAHGNKHCGPYWATTSTFVDMVNAVESDSSSTLWHKRLSHISEKGLNILAKKKL
ncbi:hypothetical protein KY290_031343 [Solanum tuberosum]|uniref:GAG-pre-integrase domain-containing protein n=1 Tax=Solanum tuberosum TaxID=4113 RepID=A0ABQ7U8W0_SOLTU|nr:hypothetical protein KY290_031343 [Solanum tuberosum]